MSALKNLTSLKRNIARKIRQALQELHENLGKLENGPMPRRVAIPVRVTNRFACVSLAIRFGKSQPGINQGSDCFIRSWIGQYFRCNQVRGAHTSSAAYSNCKGAFRSQSFRPNSDVINHFFSNANFRNSSAKKFYNTPSLTQFLKKKCECEEVPQQTYRWPMLSVIASDPGVPLALRFNKSLTKKSHIEVMDLAWPQHESSAPIDHGAYVDFHMQLPVTIPSATLLTGDVLRELLANLKKFERHLAELQKDLAKLSSLGELPLKYIESENVIRVYFPNCDREKVELLLSEQGVVLGVVLADVAGQCHQIENDDSVGSLSDFDILSSCNLSSSVSSGSNEYDDEVLSEPYGGAGNLVHLEPVSSSGPIEIVDDFLWA